jgi:hypothetical protein
MGAGLVVAALHHRGVVRIATEEVEVTLDGVARRERPAGTARELARSISRRVRPVAGGA